MNKVLSFSDHLETKLEENKSAQISIMEQIEQSKKRIEELKKLKKNLKSK